MKERFNILFLCTGNSARSQMAEALTRLLGSSRLCAFSAGSHATGNVHPQALQVLQDAGVPSDGLRSKSWDEFGRPDAPHMDLVITVCDNAAGEVCPYWPGQPATAHWGFPDPSAVEGDDAARREAFRLTLHALRKRLELLVNLPTQKLEKTMLQTSARDLATRS